MINQDTAEAAESGNAGFFFIRRPTDREEEEKRNPGGESDKISNPGRSEIAWFCLKTIFRLLQSLSPASPLSLSSFLHDPRQSLSHYNSSNLYLFNPPSFLYGKILPLEADLLLYADQERIAWDNNNNKLDDPPQVSSFSMLTEDDSSHESKRVKERTHLLLSLPHPSCCSQCGTRTKKFQLKEETDDEHFIITWSPLNWW